MNRCYNLRLIDGTKLRKKSYKNKQETDSHDLLETILEKNKNKHFSPDTEIEIAMEKTLLSKAIDSKASWTSQRTSKSPNVHRSTAKDKMCIKRSNTNVDYCEINSRFDQNQPQESYPTKKRKLSVENIKSLQVRQKSKKSVNVDTKLNHLSGISFINDNRERNNMNKTKKRKVHHLFWDSNLTGARRVSKRLTNLKLKKKISTDLQGSSDKYRFTRSLQKVSNEEKKSRAQKSVSTNVACKKSKRIRKPTLAKSVPSLNHSNLSNKYGKMSHTKILHPITLALSKQGAVHQLQNSLDYIDSTSEFLQDSNDCFEPKSVVKISHSIIGSEKVDSKLLTTRSPFSIASETSSEEITSSSFAEEKEINKDMQTQEVADSYEDLDKNDISLSDSEFVIENTTRIVFLDDNQEDCEANGETIVVDVETNKNASKDLKETFENSMSSEQLKENRCNNEESDDLKIEPSSERFTQENLKKFLEPNINPSIGKCIDLPTTSCSYKNGMDAPTVESLNQEEPLENVLLQ